MGRLSEVFGPIALDTDRFVRVLGFNRVGRREAAALDGDARAVVDAYVRGITAFIEQNARRLPIEFTILRTRPEPWQAEDVLVWAKMMALNLSRDWMTGLLREWESLSTELATRPIDPSSPALAQPASEDPTRVLGAAVGVAT